MSLRYEPVRQQLHTLRDYLRWIYSEFNQHDLFYGHGTDNAWDEAVHLLLQAAHLPLDVEPALLDARLLDEEKSRVLDWVEQRIEQRVPLPYLTGQAWFAGMPFHVDRRVIIPRSPILSLLDEGFQPWLGEQPVHRILDLCTGSGCIGIACAELFGEADVDLVDLSAEALEVARSNIARHELAERVTARQSDLFAALEGQVYDLIVSNPPYVDASDFREMPAEFGHEPVMALTSGEDGLDITRRILREAADYLSADGLLVVEVGNSEVALQAQFPDVPFTWVELPQGGNGVFLLTAQQLRSYQDRFRTEG